MPLIGLLCAWLADPNDLFAQSWAPGYEDFELIELAGPEFFSGAELYATDFAFDHRGNLLVTTQGGFVFYMLRDGSFASDPDTGEAVPFLDLTDEVTFEGQGGLLSIALHPDYPNQPYVYLYYTVDPTDNDLEDGLHRFTRLTRYRADPASDHRTADLASRAILLGETWGSGAVAHSWFHPNAALAFGADGSLLVSTGDSDNFGATFDACYDNIEDDRIPAEQNIGQLRAQFLRSYNGKVIRIDPLTGQGYSTNPFFTGDPDDIESKVWALGLRNPFRMTIRPGTGDPDPAQARPGALYIGNVGPASWESVYVSREGGENFGWPYWVAHVEFDPDADPLVKLDPDRTFGDVPRPDPEQVTLPVFAMHRSSSLDEPVFPPGVTEPSTLPYRNRCMIGGAFYEGTTYPSDLAGHYFFGDCIFNNLFAAQFDDADNVLKIKAIGGSLRSFSQGFNLVTIKADPFGGDLFFSFKRGIYRLGSTLFPNQIQASRWFIYD